MLISLPSHIFTSVHRSIKDLYPDFNSHVMYVIGCQAWTVFRRLLRCSGGPALLPGTIGGWPVHSPTGSCGLRGWCARVLPRRCSRVRIAQTAIATTGRSAAQCGCAVGAAARRRRGHVAGTATSLWLLRLHGGLRRPCPRRVASTMCGACVVYSSHVVVP